MTDSKVARLVIATRNKGKAREIRDLLGTIPWQVLALEEYMNVAEPAETEDTYSGNAIAKARYYAAATGEWVLADDSGLEVAALDGAPGVFSARYAGLNASDADRRARLLRELSSSSDPNRQARFVCAAALSSPTQEIQRVTEGICEGWICERPRGESGFGYDPIFVPNGYDQTFAELPERVKNQISHRARALLKLRPFLLRQDSPA